MEKKCSRVLLVTFVTLTELSRRAGPSESETRAAFCKNVIKDVLWRNDVSQICAVVLEFKAAHREQLLQAPVAVPFVFPSKNAIKPHCFSVLKQAFVIWALDHTNYWIRTFSWGKREKTVHRVVSQGPSPIPRCLRY